jgi:hypothetical protein
MNYESRIARLLSGADAPALEERFRFGSFICARHRLFYMDTPKCACTTIKWLIAHVEGFQPAPTWKDGEARLEMCIHNRAFHPLPSLLDVDEETADRVLFSGEYLRFCVVRNPYWRLVSSWMSKIRQADPLFFWANAEVHKSLGRQVVGETCGFRQFVNWVLATNDPRSCNVHWRPQARLLRPEDFTYDLTLRTESLSEQLTALFNSVSSLSTFDANELLNRYNYNESLPLVDEALYDEELAMRTYEFYKEDFETYNYARDSWIERRAGNASAKRVEAAALDQIRHRHKLVRAAWSQMTELSEQLKAAAIESESLRGELNVVKGELSDMTAARDALQFRLDSIPLSVQKTLRRLRRLKTSIGRRLRLEPRNLR